MPHNISPHHCVGFLFFAWIPPLSSVRRRRAPHSLTHTHSHSLTLTHTHSFTHCIDSFLAAFGVAGAVHRASWRSCGGCLWRGRRSTQSLLEELRRAWAPLGPRLPFAWQAQYTEPPAGAAARVGAAGAAAAFCVAGAVHRASWRSCGARGHRWGRGCLWRGRHSTQSLLEELRHAWAPLGPRLPFAWQAQYTEPPGGAAARVGAAGAAAALWWQAQYTSQHNSPQLITTYHIPTHHSSTSHTSLITAPLLITTHHSSTSHRSTSHHNSSQLITSQLITVPLLTPHFSHLTYHITTSHHNSSQLITSQLITAPLLTPLLKPHLSHQNSSQLHFSHLTSQVHFSHLPEVHIKLRYMKAWHVGLSGPLICFVANHAHSLLAESCLRCTTACDGWKSSSWSSCRLMVSRCIHCDHYVASPADHDSCDCMGDKGCRTCSGLGVVCTWFVWCMARGDTWHVDASWICATRVLSFPIFGHGSQG